MEVAKLGHGGKAYLARLFGCDPATIAAGSRDVEDLASDAAAGRVRKKGGRKKASLADPALVPLLEQAVEGHTAGSPVEPGRRWINRSPAKLATESTEQGHAVDRKTIRVCHLSPYCSKYNPIDHRLFCQISRSLQSLMLRSIELIREAIDRTTTRQGLRVVTELARKLYPSGIKASPEYLKQESVIQTRSSVNILFENAFFQSSNCS